MDELSHLRDRIETLEEEVRQWQELLAPTSLTFTEIDGVPLTRQEARVFAHLIAREMPTKISILSVLTNEPTNERCDKIADVYIHKLRRKLPNARIKTVHSRGWMLLDRDRWRSLAAVRSEMVQ